MIHEKPQSGAYTNGRWGATDLLVVSLLVFCISCALPALEFDNGATWSGIQCFGWGFLGPLQGHVEGLANIFYLKALIAFGKQDWKKAFSMSRLALIFTIETFFLFWQKIPLDEAGANKILLISLREGFYCWVLSFIIILMLSWYMLRRITSETKGEHRTTVK